MTDHTTPAASFVAALCAAGSPFRAAVVNSASASRDGERALAAAGRLRSYRSYLEQARAYKAATKDVPSRAIDGQVLTHARDALGDIGILAGSAVSIVRNMDSGGALEPLAQSWRQALAASGTIAAIDAWTEATLPGPARDAIRRMGLDDALLDAIGDGVRSTDARLSADGDGVVIVGTFNGVPAQASLPTTPKPVRASSVADLLARSRFDAVADAVQRGEPAYLNGVPFLVNDMRIPDVTLYGALAAHVEVVRHVRKLEDTGLETYRGGGPGVPLIVIIALALLTVGAVITIAACSSDNASSSDSDGCTAGRVLAFLGGMILLGLWGSGVRPPTSTTSSNLSMGSALIHGVIKDFELSPS